VTRDDIAELTAEARAETGDRKFGYAYADTTYGQVRCRWQRIGDRGGNRYCQEPRERSFGRGAHFFLNGAPASFGRLLSIP
jgi:hypothetical protein